MAQEGSIARPGEQRAGTAPIDFELRGEFIPLDALLKATGIASSGGVAKMMVAAGDVQVNGHQELRKTCKIRAGQVVSALGRQVRVRAAAPA